MRIILNNSIRLPQVSDELGQLLKKNLTLPNPIWLDNERQGRWNKGVPRYLEFYRENDDSLEIPRGYMRPLINILGGLNIHFDMDDQRRMLPETQFCFKGDLKSFQKKAVEQVLKKHFAVLTAPTGSGKTVMMLAIIAQRKQPTLIVVHTRDLATQWINRIGQFLGLPEKEVGFIGSGKFSLGKHITVAMIQSLYKRIPDIVPHVGHLVVDECHRTPSRTFYEGVRVFDSYYMTGLSATPYRRDRLSSLIFWHLGDQAFEVNKKDLVNRGHILQAEVILRPTSFTSQTDPTYHYGKLMAELIEDQERNELIASDVAHESKNKHGVCLVLSDRKNHCRAIEHLLKSRHGLDPVLLTGDLKADERHSIMERLDRQEISILIATSQLLGEGFDSKQLSSLFLIYPIRFSGRLLQYLGRILRPGNDKKARVFDYVDANIGVLEAAANARQQVYHQDGSGPEPCLA
ncbi:MAG: DEAD/DEAH box helicase [Proteobacteria bacterium]|nr:DEAD/DEAH box helicase [Pseudomonadota bacterium]